MGNMASKSGNNGIQLDQFEYAYAAESFKPDATSIKVYIPKLMSTISANGNTQTKQINNGVFANGANCKVTGASSVSAQNYINARVVDPRNHTHPWLFCFNAKYGTNNCPNTSHANTCHHPGESILAPCQHDHWHFDFPNEKNGGGDIPAGAKLIVFFMNGNINDCWVTRFICHY